MVNDVEIRTPSHAPLAISVVPDNSFSPSQAAAIAAATRRSSKIAIGGPAKESEIAIDVILGSLGAGQNAESKATSWWPVSGLPRLAEIRIEGNAITTLEADGRLGEIVTHEILHCLGFGLSWGTFGLVTKVAGDPVFTGKETLVEYKTLLAAAGKDIAVAGVPVEDEGIPGQSGIHWRELTFGNELMTTAQPVSGNPLSRMTIVSLVDLGYGVDLAQADAYALPA